MLLCNIQKKFVQMSYVVFFSPSPFHLICTPLEFSMNVCYSFYIYKSIDWIISKGKAKFDLPPYSFSHLNLLYSLQPFSSSNRSFGINPTKNICSLDLNSNITEQISYLKYQKASLQIDTKISTYQEIISKANFVKKQEQAVNRNELRHKEEKN